MFDVNNRFWQFLNKMTDQFLLSLLWLLCSVPIITFGASTTAFFAISMELQQDEEGTMYRDFFRIFRSEFRRGTLVWLTQLAVFAVVAADLRLCWLMDSAAGWFLLPVIAMLGLLFLIVSFFTWPLLSHSSASLPQIWRAAARTALTYLPYGIAFLLMVFLGVFIGSYVPYVIPLIPGVVTYQYARVYVWVFRREPALRPVLDCFAADGDDGDF